MNIFQIINGYVDIYKINDAVAKLGPNYSCRGSKKQNRLKFYCILLSPRAFLLAQNSLRLCEHPIILSS